MSFGEYQRRKIEEALRQRTQMGRALGRSQFDLLLNSRIQDELRAASQANKLIQDSIRATGHLPLGNLIDGISIAAREAVEKTISGFNAFAANSLRQGAIEALRALSISDAHKEALGAVGRFSSSTAYKAFAATIPAFASAFPRDTLERTAQAIAEANRIDISKIGAITGSSALAALDFSKFSNDIEQIRAIHTSYSGQLASALRDLLNAQEISEETVRPIQALINLKVDSLPQGRISAEGLMTLLLTLISVLIAYGSYGIAIDQSTSSEETAIAQARQSSQITDLLRRLVEDTQRLIPDQDQSTYYVVEREVILRLKPTSKSAPFGSLFPNQKVRGVQRSHKWIYVEYFDEIEGVPRYGWAYKKYFQHISRDNLNNVFSPRQSPDELSESLTIEERLAITDNWEQTNAKRVELIHKQIKNIITAGETRELDHLQRLADQRIRLLAPLPIEPLKTVLDNVTRRN